MSNRFRLRGKSICADGVDWPPLLKDPSCATEWLEWIVEAMNEKNNRESAAQTGQPAEETK